jgi:hypothetical protein
MDHHMGASSSRSGPPITIVINPEARVSATVTGPVPAPPLRGHRVVLPVKITNKAQVTVQLVADLQEDVPSGAVLEFHPSPLEGLPEEFLTLEITLTQPKISDVTIGFQAQNTKLDLGGQNRIHLLMRCMKTGSAQLRQNLRAQRTLSRCTL